VTDGGVMIDLAEMKEIAIDPERMTATAQGGVIWAELNGAAGADGLAVTGGTVSATGIAGYTLGGGLGWLMAKYGLASDNLLAVELVTATGDVLTVDADSHPDLFWALRGGGGNFGVATSFTYRLHPVRTVIGGLIAHPLDAAPELLRFYRETSACLRASSTPPTAPARSLRRWSSSISETPPRRSATSSRSRFGGRRWWFRSGRCRTRR
jgi:FAD/FMN-containing dehydrogenase